MTITVRLTAKTVEQLQGYPVARIFHMDGHEATADVSVWEELAARHQCRIARLSRPVSRVITHLNIPQADALCRAAANALAK